MLFDGGFSRLYQLRFSPDGTLLALASETSKNVTVKIMTRAGAGLSGLRLSLAWVLGLPSWTLDSKAVIVFERRTLRTYRVPIDDPARRSPFAAPHWVGIAIRQDGTFATRVDRTASGVSTRAIKQINSTYPVTINRRSRSGAGCAVPDYDGNGVPRILAQPVSRRPRPGDRLCARARRAALLSPSIPQVVKSSTSRLCARHKY